MSRKSLGAVIAVIIIVIIAAVLALSHKSPSKTASNAGGQKSSSQASTSSAIITTKTDPTLGSYLADSSGKALYAYDKDSSGVSNCTGSCLATWPAYTAQSSSANLPAGVATITRPDNHQVQYTYNGMPLYYFVSDSGGNVTGNGVEGFSVAKPQAPASTNTTPSQTQSSTPSNSSDYPY